MPLDPKKLLALKIPAVEHSYGPKDCMLYALGLGLGQDPLNADELAFVYEKNLKVLPTFALMQGYAAYWLRQPELGVTDAHMRELVFHDAATGCAKTAAQFGITGEPVNGVGQRGGVVRRHQQGVGAVARDLAAARNVCSDDRPGAGGGFQ